jgi:hypothetical protein
MFSVPVPHICSPSCRLPVFRSPILTPFSWSPVSYFV